MEPVLKDFCLDKHSDYYSNKLKVASILWKEVRVSKNEKNIHENVKNEKNFILVLTNVK